jgi:hypothetical protein
MKKGRKSKLVEEIITILKSKNIEITHSNISNWVMSQIMHGNHEAGKYGCIKQGDISQCLNEIHNIQSN